MKTKYTIKNFRVFDKNGVTVDFAPLTFLVGCNSSGKSSIVKSLTLLRAFFKNEFDLDHPVINSTIDFSTKPNDSLGSFNDVVRAGSRKKEVVLSYEVYSSYIDEDVVVTLTLGNGELGNAIISAIDISKKDGTILVSANSGSFYPSGNLLSIKDAFKQYLIATRLRMNAYSRLSSDQERGFENGSPETLQELDKYEQDALQYCSAERLKQICENWNIKGPYTDEYVRQAIDKFAETGIMTYYSIFDELAGIASPQEVSYILKSKVKESELHDTMIMVIDHVSEWFKQSGCPDFPSFYRSLEDTQLFNSDHIDLRVIVGNYHPTAAWLLDNDSDLIQAIRGQWSDTNYLTDKPYFTLVKDMLFHLVKDEPYSYIDYEIAMTFGSRFHPLYKKSFNDFVKLFCLEVVSKDITEELEYIGSSRIQVRRMYPMEDRNEFSDAVRRYFQTKTNFMSLNPPITVRVQNDAPFREVGPDYHPVIVSDFMPGSFMNKWLQVFKIGDHMTLEMDKNGLGLLLKVYRSASDKKGILLADMGYGITQLFSILLQIEEMIMSTFYHRFRGIAFTKKKGMGVPILDKYNDTPFEPRTVAIEEPEIHLHPKYQSLLAEMLFEAYKEYNIQFIIETHSEYLLRKIQTLVGAKKLSPEEVSMIYVEDEEEVKKGAQKVRRIPVKEDGCLASKFGSGFYDEADSLAMSLLRIKGGLE